MAPWVRALAAHAQKLFDPSTHSGWLTVPLTLVPRKSDAFWSPWAPAPLWYIEVHQADTQKKDKPFLKHIEYNCVNVRGS